MAKKSLFAILAGQSEATFSIGGVTFQAAPMTILEYAEYLAVNDGDVTDELRAGFADVPQLTDADLALYTFCARELRKRLAPGQNLDAAALDTRWLCANYPQSRVNVLTHLLVHGELPPPGGPGEKKASP